jgi:uncharacterized protein
MEIVLVVTKQCNFACRYCYEKNKKIAGGEMPFETARKILDFFLPHLRAGDAVHLFGGEPLLVFPLVKKIISYIKSKNGTVQIKLDTNGSLLSGRIIDFLRKNKVSLTLSIDGGPKTQNFNRRAKDKSLNTYNVIAKSTFFKKIINYPQLQINQVAAMNCVNFLAQDFFHLVKLGFRNINIKEEKGKIWSSSKLEILEKELRKINYYCLKHQQNIKIKHLSGYLDNPKGGLRKKTECHPEQMVVALPGGDIFPCSAVLSVTKKRYLKNMKVISFQDLKNIKYEEFFKIKRQAYLEAYDKMKQNTLFMGKKVLCAALLKSQNNLNLKKMYENEKQKAGVFNRSIKYFIK